MTTFKRLIFSITVLFVSFSLNAQALRSESFYVRPTYQRLQSVGITTLRYSGITKDSVTSKTISLGKNPNSRFGFAMEDVLKEMIRTNQGRKNTWVNAGYRGVHGIDGLLLKTNSRGWVTGVNVYEFKTQDAKLEKFTASGPQMSKKWIMSSLKKSIAEREKSLSKLKNEITAAKSKGQFVKAGKLKAEFSKINKERNQLIKAKDMIRHGQYKRYLARLRYANGKIETTIQKIEGETRSGKPKLGSEKILKNASFSVLDKDNATLTNAQRKFKASFFREIKKELTKQGKTPEEAEFFINEIREKGINIEDSVQKRAIDNLEKSAARSHTIVKGAFAVLAIASEFHAIYQWQTGKISTSEFIFNSISNASSLGMLFIKAIGNSTVITTAIFCAIDIAKNVWAWHEGRMNTQDFALETVSSAIALISATVVSKIVGLALGVVNPILGFFIGTVVFFVVYSAVKWFTKFIGKKVVNHYEAMKQPERFTIICDEVRRVYNL